MSLRTELDHAIKERDRLNVIIAWLEERAPTPVANNKRVRPAGKRPTAAVAAEEALRKAGRPMKTPELLLAVQALGAKIKDSDGLYKTLARYPKFKREGRGLWALNSEKED